MNTSRTHPCIPSAGGERRNGRPGGPSLPHRRILWINGCVLGVALIVSLWSLAFDARATTYYTDPTLGDNILDGLSSVPVVGHGPKLTIAGAIVVASSGDSIVSATGTYQEVQWNLGANNLTLYPQGQV